MSSDLLEVSDVAKLTGWGGLVYKVLFPFSPKFQLHYISVHVFFLSPSIIFVGPEPLGKLRH